MALVAGLKQPPRSHEYHKLELSGIGFFPDNSHVKGLEQEIKSLHSLLNGN